MLRVSHLPNGFDDALARIENEGILARIWAHDYTVWKTGPDEITDRLGWLHVPFSMEQELDRVGSFVERVRADGFKHTLLLGMGGSSLAPETLAKTFGRAPGSPELTVLDSTQPGAVLDVESRLDLSRTLFIVATKSGTTVETLSLFRYFYHRVDRAGSGKPPGEAFIAITDPGSPLVELAARHRFRETFLNDPNIGGRYSALSFFGLLPAALLGVDLRTLLDRSENAVIDCARLKPSDDNPAVRLGAFLGIWAKEGRDKATFALSDSIGSFGYWVEQLIAESTGKEGTGILPVVGEPLGPPCSYGEDRVFVDLRLAGDPEDEGRLARLESAGHPIVRIGLNDRYSLGEQFFLWELAIAVAGHVLGINPFDQPNVEASKVLARQAVETFHRTGELPTAESPPLTAEGLLAFLSNVRKEDYIAIQAYLPPGEQLTDALTALRIVLWNRTGVATTLGYGPRFLHSTGQLHKGDRGNGHFVQLVTEAEMDVPIPGEAGTSRFPLTFQTLITSQASGDRQALLEVGRPVATFAVPCSPVESILRTVKNLEGGRTV